MSRFNAQDARLGGRVDGLRSVAIAGAWGYIGRRLLKAAVDLGLEVHVYDTGPLPEDLESSSPPWTRAAEESSFYELPVDLFHLALHPERRQSALGRLLQRAQTEDLWILNEKPMVAPGHPEEGLRLMAALEHSRAVMLFDFPELFDPLTDRVLDLLACQRQLEITSITLERSKDREDPNLARNFKRMTSIQYQESVHCLAYVLNLLGRVKGSLESLFSEGLSVRATAEPYAPPNPEDYPIEVDGRCDYSMELGSVKIQGLTNFKRGAPWTKRRIIRGTAEGRPLTVEVEYLEDHKYLKFQGMAQPWDPRASSYEGILTTMGRWRSTVPRQQLLGDVYPSARLAWIAYQLSGVLWQCSHHACILHLPNLAALDRFRADIQTSAGLEGRGKSSEGQTRETG